MTSGDGYVFFRSQPFVYLLSKRLLDRHSRKNEMFIEFMSAIASRKERFHLQWSNKIYVLHRLLKTQLREAASIAILQHHKNLLYPFVVHCLETKTSQYLDDLVFLCVLLLFRVKLACKMKLIILFLLNYKIS